MGQLISCIRLPTKPSQASPASPSPPSPTSTSSPKPTVIIVPGSWQRPGAYAGFRKLLGDAGYATEHVALPSVGGTALPLTGLAEDVAAVRAVLRRVLSEGAKDVVLLCHSSGGVVGANAVEGFERDGGGGGARVGLVFMAAFMLPQGKSLLDMLGGKPFPWMDVQGDRVVGVPSLIPQVAFNDLDAAAQAHWLGDMTHTSAALFASPSGFEPWAPSTPVDEKDTTTTNTKSRFPCAYIFCSEDNACPYPIQQQMAAQLGPGAVTRTVEAGHCPFLSVPDRLLEAFAGVEGEMMRL